MVTVSAGYAFSKLTDKVLTDAASGIAMAALILFVGLFWILGKKLDRVVEKS